MKKFLILFLSFFIAACSSMIPYKDQNLDYLQGIEKDPAAYRGQVVSFGGEVKGITEDTLRLRLVLKIDAPLYYYATGKGNALSYEMLLVTFNKRGMPAMTGIKKGHNIKVLARVSSYETRKNFTGDDIAVLHLIAFALSNHTTHKDFFRPETPDRQLYESWKKGRLFFEESAQEVISRYPVPSGQDLPVPVYVPPAEETTPAPAKTEPEKGIIFDEEEPTFIVNPEKETAEETKKTEDPAPQPQEKTVCPEQTEEPSAAPIKTEQTNALSPAENQPSSVIKAADLSHTSLTQEETPKTDLPEASNPVSTELTPKPEQTEEQDSSAAQPTKENLVLPATEAVTAPAEALPASNGAN